MSLLIKIDSAFYLREEFRRVGRENTFTTEGYHALIELFDELDDAELDVIALSCEYNETPINAFISDYSIDVLKFEEWSEENEDDDKDNYESYLVEELKEYVETNGYWYQLLDHDTRIIYQCF